MQNVEQLNIMVLLVDLIFKYSIFTTSDLNINSHLLY